MSAHPMCLGLFFQSICCIGESEQVAASILLRIREDGNEILEVAYSLEEQGWKVNSEAGSPEARAWEKLARFATFSSW